MNDGGFPWTGIGPVPEPHLAADFASRVIEQARRTRTRQRRTKLALGAATAIAAALLVVLSMRPSAQNNQTAMRDSNVSSNEIAYSSLGETTYASNDEDSDLLTVMMPDARQAERFDAYYGPAGWTSYSAWNPVSYDSYR